jgi:CheY-like chemotaxis protein
MAHKILIIDDDVDTLRLVGLMLQKQGYEIIAANNGPQGLTHAEEQIPDLILLDVMMPGMDGYEVARRLRAGTATAHIPILMFTAKSQLDDQLSGFEAGADDYLTKPTHPTELNQHVKALLEKFAAKKPGINPPTAPLDQTAYMIGVLAARGGVGVTSAALNLASALQIRSTKDAIMVETRPGYGTLNVDLDIAGDKGLAHLLNSPITELTRQRVRDNLFNLNSELKLLLASPHPKDSAQGALVNQYEVIFNRLQHITRFCVLDFGNGLAAATQKLAPSCNELLIIVEPMQHAVTQTRILLEDLASMGIPGNRIMVAVNYRYRSDMQLSVTQIQEKLGHPIAASFTAAPELFFQALRAKTSAYLMQPDSLTRQQYTTLANQILERVPKPRAQ